VNDSSLKTFIQDIVFLVLLDYHIKQDGSCAGKNSKYLPKSIDARTNVCYSAEKQRAMRRMKRDELVKEDRQMTSTRKPGSTLTKNNKLVSPSASKLSLFDPSEIETTTRIQKIVNEFGEEITKVDGEIPVDLEPSSGERFLFISYDQSTLTHGLHKYPAKFFPELPRWLIHKYSKPGEWVLDPFTGSGTVNGESLLASRYSVGVDVDPFSKFLSKVKTTPVNIRALKEVYIWLKKQIFAYKPGKIAPAQFPDFPYRDNWFNDYILEELTFLRNSIFDLVDKPLATQTIDEATKIVNFFLICFSSIIRAVSNADDNCTRTVIRKKLNKRVREGEAIAKFLRAIDTNVPKLMMFQEVCPTDIKVVIPDGNDARDIRYKDEFFHLAVTSPPYVNAVDYPRTHQLEIYWLGIKNGSLAPLKKIHVGTETVNHVDYKYLRSIGISDADNVVAKIYEKDPRRSFILYKYLVDMQENLKEVKRVLVPGGKYAIVVGNNRMRGYLVETWKYLMGMAEKIGFKVNCYFASEIIRHFIKVPREERIQTDWVLVLEKA
jgi:DNA modification methylase